MSTTEWAKNPQTNAPRSITEPAAPEPLGDSEGAATQVVAGLEPVDYRYKGTDGLMYRTQPVDVSIMEQYPLYSAATVERLVQERDAYRSIAEGGPLDAYQSVYEQLAATIQERDEYKAVALENRDALAAMAKKADGFFDALQLAAKINAEGQAREKQLREALEICKKEMPGDKWDSLYIDGVLAFPQDDTALNTLLAAGQVREQQLREALELAEKLNILPEAPNDKAQGAGGGLIACVRVDGWVSRAPDEGTATR